MVREACSVQMWLIHLPNHVTKRCAAGGLFPPRQSLDLTDAMNTLAKLTPLRDSTEIRSEAVYMMLPLRAVYGFQHEHLADKCDSTQV